MMTTVFHIWKNTGNFPEKYTGNFLEKYEIFRTNYPPHITTIQCIMKRNPQKRSIATTKTDICGTR